MFAPIPYAFKTERRTNLPWLTDECHAAVAEKHAAEGSESYPQVAEWCTGVLRRVRASFLVKLKASIEKLPRGSKKWWALNKQLLNNQAAPPLFPPLKNMSNEWCRTPVSKANAFVEN